MKDKTRKKLHTIFSWLTIIFAFLLVTALVFMIEEITYKVRCSSWVSVVFIISALATAVCYALTGKFFDPLDWTSLPNSQQKYGSKKGKRRKGKNGV